MIGEHQIKILMLFYDLEKALFEFYEVLSTIYPEHNTLWRKLIEEEHMHAEAVRKLYKLTYEGKALFDEGTIHHAGVQSIIDYIHSITESARHKAYNEKQLLTISRDIERTLVERKLFDYFKVSSEFAVLLKTLREGSEAHSVMVEKELAKISSKP